MSPAGFEPAIPENEWPQTYALNGCGRRHQSRGSHLFRVSSLATSVCFVYFTDSSECLFLLPVSVSFILSFVDEMPLMSFLVYFKLLSLSITLLGGMKILP
jgi:hypothetical protein